MLKGIEMWVEWIKLIPDTVPRRSTGSNSTFIACKYLLLPLPEQSPQVASSLPSGVEHEARPQAPTHHASFHPPSTPYPGSLSDKRWPRAGGWTFRLPGAHVRPRGPLAGLFPSPETERTWAQLQISYHHPGL